MYEQMYLYMYYDTVKPDFAVLQPRSCDYLSGCALPCPSRLRAFAGKGTRNG